MVKILFTCKAHAYIYGRKSMNECVNTLGDSLLIGCFIRISEHLCLHLSPQIFEVI